MKEEEKRQLGRLLADYDSRYNEALCLLGEKCNSRGYHTRIARGIRVHSMERSLLYAVGLMDLGGRERIKRACDIIREVLRHQDQRPDSETFGIWPYFYEEKLEEMSPPDYNSADFCCKMLLQILLDHKEELDGQLAFEAEQACVYGCQSIIRRDAPVQYTNIAVMDCYVSIMTGLICKRRDLFAYGRDKLRRFWEFTRSNGGFLEYNSPNYTLLVARDLSLFRSQIGSVPEVSELLDEMLDFTWDQISAHFFVPSAQWMAPNARCYEDFLTDENLTDLEIATGNTGRFTADFKVSIFTYRNKLCCPPKYRKRFTEARNGFFQVLNARGFLYPYFSFAQVSSCYVTEDFALGTFNRSEFWNQIRPLKVLRGDANTCLRLQVLHDGYDFSSAMLHCAQYEGRVLGIVNFSCDRGDTHVDLDRIKDKRIWAEDLRIRFGIYGELAGVHLTGQKAEAEFAMGNTKGRIRILRVLFGDEKIRYEVNEGQEGVFYDIILYQGERKRINLGRLPGAVCGFFLDIGRTEQKEAVFQTKEEDGRLKIDMSYGQIKVPDMSVEALIRPVPFLDNGTKDGQYLDGIRLEDYVTGRRKNKKELLTRVADRILDARGSRWEMDIRHFDWVPGVGLYGIFRTYQATGEEKYLNFLLEWTQEHLREAFTQKTVNSSAPLLTVLALYEVTGNEDYLKVCIDRADEITDSAPLTADRGLEHTVTEEGADFSDQMWADTLFMVCIFLARLGRVTENRKYTDFAVEQLRLHHRFLRDERQGIYYHAWNGKTRDHMSGAHWARANAWILYSTVEILSAVPVFEGREEMELFLNEQAKALMSLQKENGMFTTLLEDPDSYGEISATAGIAAGIHRGVAAGIISPVYDSIFERAIHNFHNWIGSGGEVMGVSTGTPVMPDLEGYRTVPIRETLYGQGLMLLALAECTDVTGQDA